VKQALGQLRVKDEWLADRSRVVREVACLKLIRNLSEMHPAPVVVCEDLKDFACAMEYGGDDSRTWKQDLLSGVVNPKVTHRVADILTRFHLTTSGREDMKELFGDNTNFVQLRIEPYLSTSARRNPEITAQINEISDFLLAGKVSVVHGDFSPKNILLLADGRMWILDCEVAHYGNPVFDIAFCTNHMMLKSVHLKSRRHLNEARVLWTTYWNGVTWHDLEGEGVRTLAALMLARVDGKSPVEYLTPDEKEEIRETSRALIMSREEDFEELTQRISDIVEQGAGV
jgi:aminoglycoside phosphotransferase (APT) family kinase protein